ncbi:hypothetical protein CPB84DRAFT_1126478 [Gymnopilus junonius]|uniref:Fungal-type protein kinase domain-containing protein n=1 Tax=Gymnopilus junonius TaxID=109634 RepID=A0A9P5NJT3_GYMJU|nr:hypothetical protein CPB84DRAFT_1126478 [Gymnopilus junonius]
MISCPRSNQGMLIPCTRKEIFRDISFDCTPDGSITGTPPYMGGELLSFLPCIGERVVCYDAVQDLESFFWVLLHVCLAQSGSGGGRRVELYLSNHDQDSQSNNTIANGNLKRIIWHLFNNDSTIVLTRNKNIHPYFAPLQPFIAE